MMTKNGEFVRMFNEAFASSDTAFLTANVTDDIEWTMVGDRVIRGKEAFESALKEMEVEDPIALTINNIITHGKHAAADGTMKMPDTSSDSGKTFAFCDIYTFSGFKDPKIRKMTSYAVEL